MRTFIAFIVGLLIGVLIASNASAGSLAQGAVICGERDNVVAQLRQRYSEEPVSMGLGNGGAVVEVFASPTGSFTIVITRPSGLSCLVAAGENWENLPPKVEGPRI